MFMTETMTASEYYSNMAGIVAIIIAGAYLGWRGAKLIMRFIHWLEYRKAERELKIQMHKQKLYEDVYNDIITGDADREALRFAKQMDHAYRRRNG